jgi:hypothetical protein
MFGETQAVKDEARAIRALEHDLAQARIERDPYFEEIRKALELRKEHGWPPACPQVCRHCQYTRTQRPDRQAGHPVSKVLCGASVTMWTECANACPYSRG